MTDHEAAEERNDADVVRDDAWQEFWETVGTAFTSLPSEAQAQYAKRE
ncbi:hypothetical protein [Leucobacter sp. wl10]|nr:hypothetical protein [Leucobacter sp. wl10]